MGRKLRKNGGIVIICNVKKGIEITGGKTGPYSKPAVTESVLLGSCNSP